MNEWPFISEGGPYVKGSPLKIHAAQGRSGRSQGATRGLFLEEREPSARSALALAGKRFDSRLGERLDGPEPFHHHRAPMLDISELFPGLLDLFLRLRD